MTMVILSRRNERVMRWLCGRKSTLRRRQKKLQSLHVELAGLSVIAEIANRVGQGLLHMAKERKRQKVEFFFLLGSRCLSLFFFFFSFLKW